METYVCGDCIDDYAVKQFIRQQGEELSCDYCQQRAEDNPIAAAIAGVGDFMREGIEKEWSHPEDELLPGTLKMAVMLCQLRILMIWSIGIWRSNLNNLETTLQTNLEITIGVKRTRID